MAFVLLLPIAAPVAAPKGLLLRLRFLSVPPSMRYRPISPYSQLLITGTAASAPPALIAPARALLSPAAATAAPNTA